MINVEKSNHIKSFPVKKSVNEVICLFKLSNKEFIYSIKINLPEEISLQGNKIVFQGILFKLLKKATQAYFLDNFQNKIILIITTIEENPERVTFSVTGGGKGLSFLEKTIGKKNLFVFRDNSSNCYIHQTKQTLRKEFGGNLKIISKKNKGLTFKCCFPLDR